MTITEALAEIKTITKRVAKKRTALQPYLARVEQLRDPLEGEGGSVEHIKREVQAIRDLEERLVELRARVAMANATTVLSLNGETRTIADWLTWRREVAPARQEFVRGLLHGIENVRQQAARQAVGVVSAVATVNGDTKPTDIVVNVSEAELAVESDHLETVLGALDGQLSLKNATTQV